MDHESLAPILIAGPTASGKSWLALRLAETIGGVVINADAIQVYRELRILSARPSTADEQRAPHWLYGHVPGSEAYSAGRFVTDAAVTLQRARQEGLRPIFIGGTGLYFKALLEGLAPIPEIADDVRAHWRNEAQRIGAAGLYAELMRRDPGMAALLRASDTQRLTRALEVLESSGRSLSDWHREPLYPLLSEPIIRLVVSPDLQRLTARCDARLEAMVSGGALDEVRALLTLNFAPKLPIMTAIGVPPFAAHLRGEISLTEAIEEAKRDTRAYLKRQRTWLKRNMISWKPIKTEELERNDRSINALVDHLRTYQ
jgi:tRNA dimethylallyltransferase